MESGRTCPSTWLNGCICAACAWNAGSTSSSSWTVTRDARSTSAGTGLFAWCATTAALSSAWSAACTALSSATATVALGRFFVFIVVIIFCSVWW